MSTSAVHSNAATKEASVGKVDMKLEVITIPVSDIERAKDFYESLGWHVGTDLTPALAPEAPLREHLQAGQ